MASLDRRLAAQTVVQEVADGCVPLNGPGWSVVTQRRRVDSPPRAPLSERARVPKAHVHRG